MKLHSLSALLLVTTTFSLNACANIPLRGPASYGRIIEFKSGPEGFDTKTYFYESQSEVVAIDAQFTPELARKSIEYLRTFTPKPISWLVITHPNPDKFNGASEFKKEGARIIASKAMALSIGEVHAYKKYFFVNIAKMFTATTYPTPVSVDEVFYDKAVLNLKGGDQLALFELNQPGVSSNQTIAWSASLQALFVGDLIHHRAHAWLEGGIVKGQAQPRIENWIKVLESMSTTFPKNSRVLGGRGESVNLDQAVTQQVLYLKTAKSVVQNYIKALGKNTSELTGQKANGHYQEITKILEKLFPDYALPYMIQYGVYGLVNQQLSSAQ